MGFTHRFNDGEHVDAGGIDCRVGTACKHTVGPSLLNGPESLSNSIRTGRTPGRDDGTWSVKLMMGRYGTGGGGAHLRGCPKRTFHDGGVRVGTPAAGVTP